MNPTFSIGVDLGGTNLRVASYAPGVGFLDSVVMTTRLQGGPDAVIRDMRDAIEALAEKPRGPGLLAGIGIGTPGPLELPEGVLRNPPNLSGWNGFNLRKEIESAIGRPIKIESDANLAALAEQKCGAGESFAVDSLCMLTLGTGVGSGLVLQGRIWHGATGMGGEAGHIVVQDVDGAPCGCGGWGCLEQYASASGVVRMAEEIIGSAAPTDSHGVALLAEAGDAAACEVFERMGRKLAIGLTGLINTLNLPLYLIGGGVSEAWNLFAPSMLSELRRRSYIYRLTQPDVLHPLELERHRTYVMRARLGSAAGLLGACLLPYQDASIRPSPQECLVAHK